MSTNDGGPALKRSINLALTREQFLALQPCHADRRAVEAALGVWNHPVTAREAVAAGVTLQQLMWAAGRVAAHDPDVKRRIVGFSADCAARVLPIFEELYSTDMGPRNAILAARTAARSAASISVSALAVELEAAKASARAADNAEARAAALAAVCAARTDAVAFGAGADTDTAAAWAAWATADAAGERQWQLKRLVGWLTDGPTPTPWPLQQPASRSELAECLDARDKWREEQR